MANEFIVVDGRNYVCADLLLNIDKALVGLVHLSEAYDSDPNVVYGSAWTSTLEVIKENIK